MSTANTHILKADGFPDYKSDIYYDVQYYLTNSVHRKTIVRATSVNHAVGAICVAFPEAFNISCEPFTIH